MERKSTMHSDRPGDRPTRQHRIQAPAPDMARAIDQNTQ